MPKYCIICGDRAGSREHVFPAVLGGRRTNKGIYCGKHNQGFSPLAKILADQLKAINSLLAVRPDHGDDPSAFEFTGEDGATYSLSGENITLSKPHIAGQSGTGTTLHFKDQQQFEKWLAEQRAAGNMVAVNWRAEQRRYSAGHISIRLSLGGEEGFRAIGYVALTFLAHQFSELARQLNLAPFKDFVQGGYNDWPVWWESADLMKELPPNPFAFGHTIALSIDGSRKEAYARVSLFSTLNFGVHFGTVEAASDCAVVVHINPQSEHPPNDIQEIKEQQSLFTNARPLQPVATLDHMIKSGAGKEAFTSLLRRIQDWQCESAARAIFDELKALHNLPKHERDARVIEIVAKQGQRLFNLMQSVINGLKLWFEAQPATIGFARLLGRLIAVDSNSPNGLSAEATGALLIAIHAVAQKISSHLDEGDLTVDNLSMLIGGGPGAALIGKSIVDLLIDRVFPK